MAYAVEERDVRAMASQAPWQFGCIVALRGFPFTLANTISISIPPCSIAVPQRVHVPPRLRPPKVFAKGSPGRSPTPIFCCVSRISALSMVSDCRLAFALDVGSSVRHAIYLDT